MIADKTVTYDFARQMDGATEVPTSKFGDLIIVKMREQGPALRKEIETPPPRAGSSPQGAGSRSRGRSGAGDDRVRAHAEHGGRHHVAGRHRQERRMVNVAMHLMIEKGVNAVMVEPDASGQWGIMTDLDVLKKVISVNRSPARVKVGEIANRPLVTVKRDMSLAEASQQMTAANVRRVVVEMDGKPVGMVTDHDLFRTVEVFGWGPDA